MSNEQNLPVYTVPGTDGNPDLYFLRAYAQVDGQTTSDTQISKEQYDAITGAVSEAFSEGAASVTPAVVTQNLTDQHAAVDPASPAFSGTPALNAEVAGTAAAQTSQPPVDPGNPQVIPTAPNTNPPADQSQPEAQPVTDPGTQGTGETVPPTVAQDTQAETGTDTVSPNVESSPVPDSSSSTSAPEPLLTPTADPNAGTQPSQDSGLSGQEGGTPTPTESASSGSSQPEGSPNAQVSETQPSISNSTSDGGVAIPAVDPTDPTVVSGQPLPPVVNPTEPVIDPATGQPADPSLHPVDRSQLPDPIVVQAPPAELPVEQHPTWFAREKQAIINLLRGAENDVVNTPEPTE